MVDILVIGGGPAGLSAAITAKARNKEVLLIKNSIETSALYKAERVDNYLGMPNISGKQMLNAFTEHALNMGVTMIEERVLQILDMGKSFSVSAGGEFYEAKAIIIATGKKTEATIAGEKEFLGKGVSYCATCDGMLYKGKRVAIAGDNEEAFHDAKFLSEICKEVYFVTDNKRQLTEADNVKMIGGKISSIEGEEKVKSITVGDSTIDCNGVFIISESPPAESLIYGIALENSSIKTDKLLRTNVSGVFAAGDCTGKPFQISKAVGEGLVAALSAVHYLTDAAT